MIIRLRLKKMYISAVAVLFFFFFSAPALNPAINGRTVYLYWFIPILDIFFCRHIVSAISGKTAIKVVIVFLALSAACILRGEGLIWLRICVTIFTLYYLFYARQNNIFRYLYATCNFNILIAVCQFVLYYTNRAAAYALGPSNIAKLVWGKYATDTFTNMYSIWGNNLIRVSGWSREAGFFASFLIGVFLCYLNDEEEKSCFKRRLQYCLFFTAFVISLSKMTFMIVPILIVWMFRKQINQFSAMAVWGLYMLFTVCAASYLDHIGFYTMPNISITNRFIGYYIVGQLPIGQFLFGFGEMKNIAAPVLRENPMLYALTSDGLNLCGWSGLAQYFGIIGVLLFLCVLRYLKFSTSGGLILLLMTFNVSLYHVTSYVVLAYWIGMNEKNTMKKKRIVLPDKVYGSDKVYGIYSQIGRDQQ